MSGRLDDFRHGEALEKYAQHVQNNCVCTINARIGKETIRKHPTTHYVHCTNHNEIQ